MFRQGTCFLTSEDICHLTELNGVKKEKGWIQNLISFHHLPLIWCENPIWRLLGEILRHKPFIVLQRKHGRNASVISGFELRTFKAYLHMNDANIQSSQHVWVFLSFAAASVWKVSLFRVHRFTQIATKEDSGEWKDRIKEERQPREIKKKKEWNELMKSY